MKILAIALKDLTQSFRSLFAIGMMVAAPLLITGLIYFAFGGLSGASAARGTLPPRARRDAALTRGHKEV